MKTFAFVITLLLLAGCVSKPVRCDRRLTPINASLRTGAHTRVVEP